ncbi:MAG: hypothetical protein ACHREM_09600 [Polyangiales bacterium]
MRATRLRAKWALAICATIGATGCASILGLDNLTARGDAATDTTTDGTVDTGADTSSNDANDATTDSTIDVADTADTNAQSDVLGDTGPVLAHPPAPPTDAATTPTGTPTYWFAVSHFYLGMVDSTGSLSDSVWQTLGFDLDDVCTTSTDSTTSVGTCKRVTGSDSNVLTDGQQCRDNNFGSEIMKLVSIASPKFETNANNSVYNNGGSTWAIALDDVDPATDDGYAPGRLFRVTSMPAGSTPLWDGTDVRVVSSDSVAGASLATPIAAFPHGYITGNVWVSGPATDTLLLLPADGTSLPFPLKSVVLSVPLSADRLSASGATLAGALPVANIADVVDPVASAAGFCPGTSFYESIVGRIQQVPDLVIGAPNLQNIVDTCDGISVGIGFDLRPIKPITTIGAPDPSPPDPCADAGVTD